MCWRDVDTLKRANIAESFLEKHALPNTDCWHLTLSLRAFNAGGRGVPCRESYATKDILGVAIGTSKTHTTRREFWWLCEEVQSKVVVKQARFKELLSCREGNQKERLMAQESFGKKVIERRLRRETTVSKNQFYFMPERSSVEAIHLIRSLIEKYMERQIDLDMAFLDLEKAYDSVLRELIWKNLTDKGTLRRYIRVIRDMYDGVKTRVQTSIKNTKFSPVEVGLHQESAYSLYLFALILDELSRGIQEDIPWCLIFVDDIVLVLESTEG
ncbi:retrovirus-related pol polyprotein LINE-1, partial [Tanacetum coccineum]